MAPGVSSLLTIYLVSLFVSVVLVAIDFCFFDSPSLTRGEWGFLAFEILCPVFNTIFALVAINLIVPQIAEEINNATKV